MSPLLEARTHAPAEATLLGNPLDASSYPHLIDTILAASSLDTLLSFRATSQYFNSKVKAILKRDGCHMVVSGGKGSVANAPKVAFRHSGDRMLVPTSASFLAPFAHTVDIQGTVAHREHLSNLADLSRSLKTVRIHNFHHRMGATHLFKADTGIVSIHAFPHAEEPSSSDQQAAHRLLAKGTRKIFINLRTSPAVYQSTLSPLQRGAFDFHRSVTEAVIIVNDVQDDVDWNRNPPLDSHTLGASLLLAAMDHPGIKFVLVNVGYLCPL